MLEHAATMTVIEKVQELEQCFQNLDTSMSNVMFLLRMLDYFQLCPLILCNTQYQIQSTNILIPTSSKSCPVHSIRERSYIKIPRDKHQHQNLYYYTFQTFKTLLCQCQCSNQISKFLAVRYFQSSTNFYEHARVHIMSSRAVNKNSRKFFTLYVCLKCESASRHFQPGEGSNSMVELILKKSSNLYDLLNLGMG